MHRGRHRRVLQARKLEEDETADVTLRLISRAPGVLSSTASVSSTSPDPDMTNNEENVLVRVQPKE